MTSRMATPTAYPAPPLSLITSAPLLRAPRYCLGAIDYHGQLVPLLDLAARLTHPRHEVARVYEAIVAGEPSDEALDELRQRGPVYDDEPDSDTYI